MNDFDKAARYAAKLHPAGFFRWLLPRLDPRLVFRGWLDARRLPFPGELDRICDTVADFEDTTAPNRHWAIVVEFQSEPRNDILDRLNDYQGRLHLEFQPNPGRRTLYKVAAALLNLTGSTQPDTLEMRLPGMEEYGLRLRVVLRTLREEDAAGTLAAISANQVDRCILPWIRLMHLGGDPDIINQWKEVADKEPDSRLRAQYAGLALVFAELADRLPEWKRLLEGLNVVESQVVSEWRAQGRAQGRIEGEIAGQRFALLEFLQARFQSPLPDDVVNAIEAQTDLDTVARWIRAVGKVSSLEDFRAMLQG